MNNCINFITNTCKYDYLPSVIWDFEGRFVYCNEKFAKVLGYGRHELVDRYFVDLIHPSDVEASFAVYDRNTKNGFALVTEFHNRYIHKDGSIIYIRWEKAWNDARLQLGSGQITRLNKIQYYWSKFCLNRLTPFLAKIKRL